MPELRPCKQRIERRDGSWGPCGVLSERAYCAEHRRVRERVRREEEPWRLLYKDPRYLKAAVETIERDGHRCTYQKGTQRCQAESQLEAHHEEKLRQIWERCGRPQLGMGGWNHFVREATDMRRLRTLCPRHHKLVDNTDLGERRASTRTERSRKRRSRPARAR